MFDPVKTRRTFEEALQQIAEAIRSGDLRVGDRLPSERQLAAQMKIGRPTLREAIKVLSEAAVVEVRPGPSGGMFVRSDFIPPGLVERGTELRLSEVSGVLEARRLIEPRVAQLAAVYAREEDLEAMRRTIELQRECGDDAHRFLQLDVRFHLAVARATRNSTIVAVMRLLLHRLEIAREMAIRAPRSPEQAIEIHERTLRAIMSRDPEVIEAAMDEHVSFLERSWEEESGRAGLRRIPDFLLPRAERRET